MSDVALGASMRANLLSLQKTNSLLDATQFKLSTGKKVNSALDNPQSFFAAQSLSNRATDLGRLLDSMGQAIQTIKQTDKAVTALVGLLDQADAIAKSAREKLAGDASADVTTEVADFNAIRNQIDDLVADATYRGISLMADATTTLRVSFNEDDSSGLTLTAQDLTSSGLAVATATFTNVTAVDASIGEVRDAVATVRDFGKSLATSLGIIQNRETFTKETINILSEGADKLTLADPNEEGAKMLALQTRLQLGVTSLALAAQSQQSVLQLF